MIILFLLLIFIRTSIYTQDISNMIYITTDNHLSLQPSLYGNVGIKTINPFADLDINKNLNVRGSIFINENPISSTETTKSMGQSSISGYQMNYGNYYGLVNDDNNFFWFSGSNNSSLYLDTLNYGFSNNLLSYEIKKITIIYKTFSNNHSYISAECYLRNFSTNQNYTNNLCQNIKIFDNTTSYYYIEFENKDNVIKSTNIISSNFGVRTIITLTGNATGYIDWIGLKLEGETFKEWIIKKQNNNLNIIKTTNTIVEIRDDGINVIGDYYKNGVLFSGSGDNLGNHIATTTIIANYGIQASTISVSTINAYNVVSTNINTNKLTVATDSTTENKLFVVGNSSFVVLNDGRIGFGMDSTSLSRFDFAEGTARFRRNLSTTTKFGLFPIVVSQRNTVAVAGIGFNTYDWGPKAALFFNRVDSYDRGDLFLSFNLEENDNHAKVEDAKFIFNRRGMFGINKSAISPLNATLDVVHSTFTTATKIVSISSRTANNEIVEIFNINTNGRVGINITNPSSTLDINGDIKASTISANSLCLNGNCITNWGSGGISTITYITDNLSSQCNGSNVTFVLSTTPISGSLILTKNGLRLLQGQDFTLSGTTITMVSAPKEGDILIAWYITSASNIVLCDNIRSLNNTWTGINTYDNNTIFNNSVTVNSNIVLNSTVTLNSSINNQFIGYIDLTNATTDYLLKRGERAYITFTSTTTVPLRIQTFSGTAYKLVYFLSNNSGNSGGATSPIFLRPNNTTYYNQFFYTEVVRYNSNIASGAYTYSSFRIGWSLSNGFVYLYNYDTNKRIVGEISAWGLGEDVSTTISFSSAWSYTTTSWTSLGTITFPVPSSGVVIVERIF